MVSYGVLILICIFVFGVGHLSGFILSELGRGKVEDMADVERCVCCGNEIPEGRQVCFICGYKAEKKKTNYDRIRDMDIDKMARFMQKCGWDFPPYCDFRKATTELCDHNCIECAKKYLESEVDSE